MRGKKRPCEQESSLGRCSWNFLGGQVDNILRVRIFLYAFGFSVTLADVLRRPWIFCQRS